MKSKGLIFDIQRFSIHDGPGIRSLVFLKGCPLKCLWCQNPESLDTRSEIGFTPTKCIGCGTCNDICPTGSIRLKGPKRIERSSCLRCGECADACPSRALERIGKEYTPEEVLDEVMKDESFYATSGGGVTFSGGEPLLQIDFLVGALKLCKKQGLHTAIETSGYTRYPILKKALPLLDLVLYDLKVCDPADHKRFTGKDNRMIIQNLKKLRDEGIEVAVRVPLVPTFTLVSSNIVSLASLISRLGYDNAVLLPYHRMGESKLPKIDSSLSPLGINPPSEHEVREAADDFRKKGIGVEIGGG